MTTENNPVGIPAATDENGQRSHESDAPEGEQPPTADPGAATVAEQPSESADGLPEASIVESAAPAPAPAPQPESPAAPTSPAGTPQTEPPATTEEAATTPPVDSAPPAETSPSAPSTAVASAATETPAPPRRVQLNPTVAPDALKPIPSLRPTEAPPTASPQADASAAASEEEAAAAVDSSAAASSADVAAAMEQHGTSHTAESVTDQTAAESTAPPPPAEPVAIPSQNESLDADLEAELEAAMAGAEQESETAAQVGEAVAEAAAALNPDAEVKRGMRIKGTVQSIHGDDMFVELGLRMAGVLSRRQFGLRKQPMQGEPLEIVVHRVDEKEGLIHVNLPTGTSKVRGDWEALTVDQNVECLVNGTNKGGLEVTIGSLRGFMPASQVELGYVPDLSVFVGQKLKARIAEVNPKRRKLVLSRRALLEEEREQSRQELFEKVQPGQQYTGRVRTIKDYGAFVDIGGADGLLHVAQISWTRINHPSEVLKEGEEVEVQVLSVDKDKKKISLGMRQLTQNPWKAAESKYAQGAHVKGKVTRIENFGAFIELEAGVEGLVHISELDHKRIKRVTEVLRVGQEVDVQVLEVDPKRKRVGLSVKALKEKPEAPEQAASAPIKRQRSVDSLVGGTGEQTGGQLFGDPNKFGR